jgi:nucleotide-binding universal stress UspA family protein
MISKVMAPLDGSEFAEKALPFAAEVAARAGAELLLFTSVQPVGVWDATASAINWEREEQMAEDYLQEKAASLRGRVPRVRVLRRHGEPASSILDVAESEGVSLIVMSTHGRTGLLRFFFGSTTDRVVQHARCPLLLVRIDEKAPPPAPRFSKILVPLDGSEVAASALPFVEEFARLHGAAVVLYHAIPPLAAYPGIEAANPQMTGEVLEEMQREAHEILSAQARRLQARGIEATVAVSIDLATEGILEAARSTGAGLIAIGTHGRSGFGRALLGSVANAVVRRSGLPVLLVRPTGGS